ncbi:OLC1v1008551C1 [Oldenlandia corymbosa var. corymbosa]|uniref:OLC1v1008551C1 n=1 Tax=Oldenlandia corymbosa var. corymbosa TaxID=529605 RepID=A0AAV1DLX9_OLDCO|nr:OLC1v1008551C1 [Oldenlandia corymbosa var. corymbosa]
MLNSLSKKLSSDNKLSFTIPTKNLKYTSYFLVEGEVLNHEEVWPKGTRMIKQSSQPETEDQDTPMPDYPELDPDPDSQDPWEYEHCHDINWDGCGLFWFEPYTKEYYEYHCS